MVVLVTIFYVVSGGRVLLYIIRARKIVRYTIAAMLEF